MFATAFVAGAAAAIGVNQALDVHLAQQRPQVESEPIFVALRSLAQGAPVTVWDVALRDWPKAMLPTTAMRADDSFEGCLLRHPLREGQPLLKVQLVRDDRQARTETPDLPAFASPTPAAPVGPATEPDLWTPAPAESAVSTTTTVESATVPPVAVAASRPTTSADVAPPVAVAGEPTLAEPPAGEPTLAEPPAGEPTLADTSPPADAGVKSVVAARSVTTTATDPQATVPSRETPADLEAAAARKPRDGVVRYLVVPERVALQADAGFAEPAPAPAVALVPAPASRTDDRSVSAVRPAAPAASTRSAQSRPQRPTPQAAQPQSRTPRQQATQPSRQPRRQAAPPTPRQPTASAPRGFSGMFPNIAAGIDAMTGRKSRAAEGGFDEAVATDDPAVETR